MSVVDEINYHIRQSGMKDKAVIDCGVLEHWRQQFAHLETQVELGDALAGTIEELLKAGVSVIKHGGHLGRQWVREVNALPKESEG